MIGPCSEIVCADPVPGPRTKTLRLGIGPVHRVGTLGTLGSTMVID